MSDSSHDTPPLATGDVTAQPDDKTGVYRELLKGGRYSDFVLVSHGKRFSLHKSVVLLQSPVMEAAFAYDFKVSTEVQTVGHDEHLMLFAVSADSIFQESQTDEIRVNDDFDLETVERMLDFLYTGSYEITIAASHNDDAVKPSCSNSEFLLLATE